MQNTNLQPAQAPLQQPVPQQLPVSSDEIYANHMQEDRVTNLISQTSPDIMLVDLQWRIKGYLKNPVTGEYKKINEKVREPAPELVANFISYLSSILSDNTRMSNLSDLEINRIMKLIIEWVVDDLDTNSEIYGLEHDYAERTRLGHIVLNSTFMALKRALNGMESRRIFGALTISEGLGGMQKKKGLLDSLKFWKP